MVRKCLLSVCVFGVLLPGAARGQQIVASASVSGTVHDSSDAVVPSAIVRLHSDDTNQVLERVTDARGRYRFVSVPVGTYELTAEAPGFAPARTRLDLTIGKSVDVSLQLMAAGVSQIVAVTAEVPLVEATRVPIADTIVPTEIDRLPLNGRNYLDLALLAPNVSRTNTRSNERFAETSAVPGTGISIAGQRNLANTFIVDGLSANDDAADLSGTYFSEEVIREFQVITSGGTAEFGRASTGIVNVVTQSGTNQYRGRAYGFFRNERFDARNALAMRKDPLTQSQYGLTLGGPIAMNRTFWFANLERTQQNKNGVVTIIPANVTAINAALVAAGYRGPAASTGEFRTGYDTTNVFARLDHAAGASRVQLRYSGYTVHSQNARGVGGLNSTSRGTPLDDTDRIAAGTWQVTPSNSAVDELRVQRMSSRLAAPPNDLIGPAISISGVANLGTSTSSPTRRDLVAWEIANTFTRQRGSQLFKAGADFLHDGVTIEFPGALQGSYTFTSLTNLQRGAYQQFQQAFGEPALSQSNPNLGVFVQDEWTARTDLTVTSGLRYDLQWLPSPIQLDANNVSPRIGMAWASGNRRTVVRGSGGLYFDRVPLRATSNALQRDGIHYKVAVLSFGEAAAPVFPVVRPSFPADVLTAITAIDRHIQNGRSGQAAVQVERGVGGAASLSAAYLYLHGHGIIMQRNANVPTLTAAQASALGVPNLGRPNPNFGNISRYESIGDSWFNGLTLSFNARAAWWGSVRASYTLSRALDTSGNAFFNTPQNNFDVAAEKGPSDNDQHHRLVISGVAGTQGTVLARALGGVQLGYLVSLASGVPFNVVAGSDLNNDTTNNDRPPGVPRNSARQARTSSVDLRASRVIVLPKASRIEVLVEAFNIFNHVNILALNNTFGTGSSPLATFRQPTLAGDARQLQAGIRWSF
jgi:hypothetical protein